MTSSAWGVRDCASQQTKEPGFQASTVLGVFADHADEWADGLMLQVRWGVFKMEHDGDGCRLLSLTYDTKPHLTFTPRRHGGPLDPRRTGGGAPEGWRGAGECLLGRPVDL